MFYCISIYFYMIVLINDTILTLQIFLLSFLLFYLFFVFDLISFEIRGVLCFLRGVGFQKQFGLFFVRREIASWGHAVKKKKMYTSKMEAWKKWGKIINNNTTTIIIISKNSQKLSCFSVKWWYSSIFMNIWFAWSTVS